MVGSEEEEGVLSITKQQHTVDDESTGSQETSTLRQHQHEQQNDDYEFKGASERKEPGIKPDAETEKDKAGKDTEDIFVVLGTLQMSPVYGDIDASIAKADLILQKWSQSQNDENLKLDLLVLPEMAFTGYQFRTRKDIEHLAEVAGKGPTFDWCQRVASTYGCSVSVGFPRLEPETGKLYNSIMLVNPSGQLHTTYDKHFLYISDKSWASEGNGFLSTHCDWLGPNGTKVGLGICMDINPWEFKSAWSEFEFARFHSSQKSRIIAFSSAWCNRHPDDPTASPVNGAETINYWFARLSPLIHQKTIFVAADRVGVEPMSHFRPDSEGDVTFCGSSCIIDMNEPELFCHMGTMDEGIVTARVRL
mmetsp:Transcript_21969/g.43185  ORF Transcript_21969/g.43185 Transcript_21969/m.43185 type:complete len:363 (+) Transcript_21969:121-1209(+)